MQVPEQIGRYQIIGMIGKGGMGFVLKGYDATLQRQVAIKVLYPHLAQDENTVARFLTEARTAASLQHPNIIAIYEAGEDRGLYYFAMEFVDGKDLGTIIRERGRLRLEEALPILEQIGMALDYAHQRGIIHRDIKASNIMVTVDGLVKVTDFGIARVLGGERFTQTGVLVGTPEYMAPELWEGHEASKASDIYALGVLTYEMLTGEVPFTGTTPMAIGYKHVHEEVPVDKLRGIISDDALEALKISLAKSPERRFQSAVAFVRALKGQAFDLTQATKSTPVATPEPSVSTASVSSTTPVSLPTPPTTVAVKRPRWLVWVAGFLFVLGLVVIILGGQVNRLLSERRLEQEIYKALEERRLISPPNDNALELYRRLRREFPNSATFQRVQAKVLNVLRGEINRGFDNFYRTSKEDSQMWQELKKLCDWAVDIAPYDNWLKARQRYCYGRLEFLAKRYDNAILAYKEAIQNDPNWALPYNSIGVVYIRQKNWAKVVEWCSQAKRHDSDWVFPYLNVGWAFYNLRRYDEAEKEYRQAIELDPDRPTPYCRLSCLYEKKGWILDALEEAQKAMEVAEKNPDRWEEQIKDLQKRLERLRRKVGSGEGEGVYD